MGTVISRNEFSVTGCSSPVEFINFPITTILKDNFKGDTTELGPLPSSISLTYESNNFKFKITSNSGAQFINFTVNYGSFGVPTVIDENSSDYFQIQPTNSSFSSTLQTVICQDLKDKPIYTSILLKALVFKTIPGFILAGDLYTIDIIFSGQTQISELFINAKIGRPKSNVINN
jgi:hypothetical protein